MTQWQYAFHLGCKKKRKALGVDCSNLNKPITPRDINALTCRIASTSDNEGRFVSTTCMSTNNPKSSGMVDKLSIIKGLNSAQRKGDFQITNNQYMHADRDLLT